MSGCKDHYQVHGWQAWHHHMTMVMLAMLYMLETRLSNYKIRPLLSCADIEVFLSHCLEGTGEMLQLRGSQCEDGMYAQSKSRSFGGQLTH